MIFKKNIFLFCLMGCFIATLKSSNDLKNILESDDSSIEFFSCDGSYQEISGENSKLFLSNDEAQKNSNGNKEPVMRQFMDKVLNLASKIKEKVENTEQERIKRSICSVLLDFPVFQSYLNDDDDETPLDDIINEYVETGKIYNGRLFLNQELAAFFKALFLIENRKNNQHFEEFRKALIENLTFEDIKYITPKLLTVDSFLGRLIFNKLLELYIIEKKECKKEIKEVGSFLYNIDYKEPQKTTGINWGDLIINCLSKLPYMSKKMQASIGLAEKMQAGITEFYEHAQTIEYKTLLDQSFDYAKHYFKKHFLIEYGLIYNQLDELKRKIINKNRLKNTHSYRYLYVTFFAAFSVFLFRKTLKKKLHSWSIYFAHITAEKSVDETNNKKRVGTFFVPTLFTITS